MSRRARRLGGADEAAWRDKAKGQGSSTVIVRTERNFQLRGIAFAFGGEAEDDVREFQARCLGGKAARMVRSYL